jgi:ribosomal-protein-alanine N-acetyltransferase
MNYTIVSMTADHLDQMEEIERICFTDPWSRRMLAENLENDMAVTLVAQGENGAVLGYACLLVVLDEGTVTNLAVRPEYRRSGIATELLEVFRRFGEGTGLAFLTLEVRASNAGAIALYEKLGYAQAGLRRNYYEHPREDAVIMTREFAP